MKKKNYVKTQKPSPDKESTSQILRWDFNGNWTHDAKSTQKSEIDYSLEAHQSHKYQKTKHKKLIQHLHWKAYIVTMNASQSWGRGGTDKRTAWALKDNGTAQHPNWARNCIADLWCLCISWPNMDNRTSSPIILVVLPKFSSVWFFSKICKQLWHANMVYTQVFWSRQIPMG